MKSKLFRLANQGDTYAQSFFTKVIFNCKDKSIDMWINLPYLYSISEYVRTFLFKHNEKSIDIEDYDSIIVKSCIEGLHKQVVKTCYKIKVINLLNYLMIDPIIVFASREVWDIVTSSIDENLNNIYDITINSGLNTNIEFLNINNFTNEQSKIFKLYLKVTSKNTICHLLNMFEKCITDGKLSLANVLLTTEFVSNMDQISREIYNYISRLFTDSPLIKLYLKDENRDLLSKLILMSHNYYYNNTYLYYITNIIITLYKNQFLKYDKDSYISLKWLIDTLNQYTNMN